MAGTYLAERLFLARIDSRAPQLNPLPVTAYKMAALLLIVGGIVRYGLTMPIAFNIAENNIPGGILFVGNAYLAGLFLAMVL
jgi:hypothetical protein